jgi:mannose-6-phosphate isomerase-like protein (cupin superfamily)
MTKRFVRRKWGWYLTLLDCEHFKVKILRLAETKSISLQKHSSRSELWLILRGKCESRFSVECSGQITTTYLCAGDWQNIPKELWHKLIGLTATWILEIQYGDKCTEEDIVRI